MRCYGGSRGRASQACSRRGGRKAQYWLAGHQTTPPYSLTNLSLSHTVLLHSLFYFNCFLSNVESPSYIYPLQIFFGYTCLLQGVQFNRKLLQYWPEHSLEIPTLLVMLPWLVLLVTSVLTDLSCPECWHCGALWCCGGDWQLCAGTWEWWLAAAVVTLATLGMKGGRVKKKHWLSQVMEQKFNRK